MKTTKNYIMKNNIRNLIMLFFAVFIFSNNITAQQSGLETTCDVFPPITPDMFSTGDPCSNTHSDVIFTIEEFQAASNGTSSVFGVPYSDIGNEEYSQTSNDNAIDMIAGSMGGMSVEDVFDCLNIGCSPQFLNAANQVSLIGNELAESEIGPTEITGELDSDELEAINNSSYGSVAGLQGELEGLGTELAGLDFNSLIETAFGLNPIECDGEEWLGSDPPTSPRTGNNGGGEIKTKLEKKVVEQIN